MKTPDTEPKPSADAIALAVKLSGHSMCRINLNKPDSDWPCVLCLGDAATIDRELALPQRNAALLLAQGVVDAHDDGTTNWDMTPLDELREALAQIKTKP